MSQVAPSAEEAEMLDALVEAWLTCPPDLEERWLIRHQHALTLEFLERQKARSDHAIRTNPGVAEQITTKMLRAAQWMDAEPLAPALAWWARGNWLGYQNPREAAAYFTKALARYRSANAVTAVLTLTSNLLYVTTELDLAAAKQIYQEEIIPLRSQITEKEYPILLRIEQNVGILLGRLGQYEEALAAHYRALALAQTLAQEDRIPEIMGNIAFTLGDMGRFHECEEVFLQSRSQAHTTQNWLTAARIDMNLGQLYTILNRPVDAFRAFHAARTQFEAFNNTMEVASVAMREAGLLERIGSLTQAGQLYTAAKTQFEVLQMWPQVWRATIDAITVKRHLGDFHQATKMLDEAALLWQQHQQSLWRDEWQLEKGELLLAQKQLLPVQELLRAWLSTSNSTRRSPLETARHVLLQARLYHLRSLQSAPVDDSVELCTKAASAYQEALRYAEQHGEMRIKRQALAGWGHLLHQQNPDEAERLLLAAAHQDDLMRGELTVQELKASFLRRSNPILESLFSWAFAEHDYEKALRLSWRAKGSALLELKTIKQKSDSGAEIDQELVAIRRRLTTLQWRTTHNTNKQSGAPQQGEMMKREIAQLEQQLVTLRRQRNQHKPEETLFGMISVQQIASTMNADLLIEYMQADGQLYATVLMREGTPRTYLLTDSNTILDLIDELTLHFRALLTLPIGQRRHASMLAECKELLQRGHELLVQPLDIPSTPLNLLIAPCASLYRMPFAALWNGKNYLIDQHTIELTTTAALSITPDRNRAATSPLIIASTADGLLPANRTQAEELQTLFPNATTLIDNPNTLAYLKHLKIAPHLLHIAAHTVERHDAPLFTALQLADEMLTVEGSYELPLQGTELVVFSSCTTNSGMDRDGALLAFLSAFFVAGATRMVSTLWEIQSEVSIQWMRLFYTHLLAGVTPPQALRQTQLTFLQDSQLSHPVYWASCAAYTHYTLL